MKFSISSVLLQIFLLSETGSPQLAAALRAWSWVWKGRSSPSIWYNVHSSPRFATCLLSISFNDPDAAFRGFANGCSSSLRRSSLRRSKAGQGMYISPRISNSSGHGDDSIKVGTKSAGTFSSCGMLLMFLTFAVTSSPTVPSPRVNALKSFPFLYVRQMAVPSNLSSQLNVNLLPIPLAARSANA